MTALFIPSATQTDIGAYNTTDTRGGVAQWVARLTHNVEVVGSSPIKAPVVSLSKKLYPYCFVLVGTRNGFERDFTIDLK